MWSSLFIAVLCLCAVQSAVPPDSTAGCELSQTVSRSIDGPICKGALIFEDTFDFLDLSKWQYEVTMAGGGIYWEDQANTFTRDGNLMINPAKLTDVYDEDFLYYGTIDLGDRCTVTWNDGCYRTGNSEQILNPVSSGRLNTGHSFSFKYGTVEARAKIPAGDWLWPTIWLWPRDEVYGQWPASGEIDILECRSNRNLVDAGGVNIGVEQATSTLHWGPNPDWNQHPRTHWTLNSAPGEGWDQNFHSYRIEWTPDHIKFTLDDFEVGYFEPPEGGFWELGELWNSGLPNPWEGASKMAPFDQEFYLIVNVAIGGTKFFPDDASNPGGKPWNNNSPTTFRDFWEGRWQWEPTWYRDGSDNLQVDYIRVWAM